MAKAKTKKRSGGMIGLLKKMQTDWDDSEPKRGGAGVPDDDYVVRIDSVVLAESKTSQRLQIEWGMTVMEGDYEGRQINKYDGIDEPKDLPYVQGTLESLELDIPSDITDIGEVLEGASGLYVDITVKTRDEFTNIYFNEIVEGYEEAAGEATEPSPFDDLTEDSEEADFEACSDEIGEALAEADLNPDDFETWAAAWAALPEEGAESGEGGEGEDTLTEDEVNEMGMGALKTLIKEEELDIKVKKIKAVGALRKAVIKELF